MTKSKAYTVCCSVSTVCLYIFLIVLEDKFMPYHEQVIEEEDLSLVQAQLLRFVRVGHFKQSAITDQSTVR